MKCECPHCGQHYEYTSEWVGNKIKCFNCNSFFYIPSFSGTLTQKHSKPSYTFEEILKIKHSIFKHGPSQEEIEEQEKAEENRLKKVLEKVIKSIKKKDIVPTPEENKFDLLNKNLLNYETKTSSNLKRIADFFNDEKHICLFLLKGCGILTILLSIIGATLLVHYHVIQNKLEKACKDLSNLEDKIELIDAEINLIDAKFYLSEKVKKQKIKEKEVQKATLLVKKEVLKSKISDHRTSLKELNDFFSPCFGIIGFLIIGIIILLFAVLNAFLNATKYYKEREVLLQLNKQNDFLFEIKQN